MMKMAEKKEEADQPIIMIISITIKSFQFDQKLSLHGDDEDGGEGGGGGSTDQLPDKMRDQCLGR